MRDCREKGAGMRDQDPSFGPPEILQAKKNVPFGPGDSTPVGNVVVVSEARRM